MPLSAIETVLRERADRNLAGAEAQLRFAPSPVRPDWRPGEPGENTRTAAVLLLALPARWRRGECRSPSARAGSRGMPVRSACPAAHRIPEKRSWTRR